MGVVDDIRNLLDIKEAPTGTISNQTTRHENSVSRRETIRPLYVSQSEKEEQIVQRTNIQNIKVNIGPWEGFSQHRYEVESQITPLYQDRFGYNHSSTQSNNQGRRNSLERTTFEAPALAIDQLAQIESLTVKEPRTITGSRLRKDTSSIETITLQESISNHKTWMKWAMIAGFVGICIKGPSVLKTIVDYEQYKEVQSAYEKHKRSNTKYFFHVNERKCLLYVQGQEELFPCELDSTSLKSGGTIYEFNKNEDYSAYVHSTWSAIEFDKALVFVK